MEKLILHNYRRCPFCIRVRIVLEMAQCEYHVVEEPLRKWTPWMRAFSDDPAVPVLRIFAGSGTETVMPESRDIVQYIDQKHLSGELSGTDQKEKEQIDHWWTWCDTQLKPQIDLYKYGVNREYDGEAVKGHERILREMLQKIEDALEHEDYLVANKMTLAEIAIIPFIRQIMRTRNGIFDWSGFPRITQWSAQILEQEWFTDAVMKKFPLEPSVVQSDGTKKYAQYAQVAKS